MRANPALARLPVICVSASTSESDSQRSIEVGANAFLAKPIELSSLILQIGGLLGLEWIHEAAPGAAGANGGPLVPPPAGELEALHHLARVGNMADIREKAEHIASRDERYRPSPNACAGSPTRTSRRRSSSWSSPS
jgi:DNA-binding NarL/FixJ family response regulator